jgi:hypothetical protein
VASVSERTIPTERPTRIGGVEWSLWRIPRPYSRISWPEPLLFYQAAPQLYSRGWVDPVPDLLLVRKSGSAENRTRTSVSVARHVIRRKYSTDISLRWHSSGFPNISGKWGSRYVLRMRRAQAWSSDSTAFPSPLQIIPNHPVIRLPYIINQ